MINTTEEGYYYLTEELGYSFEELTEMPIDQLDRLIKEAEEATK